ncbi:4'-phosphopantetheinyl transferase superfamily protein [Acinetobacter sp. AM]|uniref:4'-phosphopantetheinyl transferase superfamily protein n=1 Tax=Acinetobacter sp. AM TaxID=2170730 RepID=UPI000E31BB02|nr:4'-phosphopantetheinyl transferase superfamily protein [Acinetobacter sp. AM]
MFDGLEFISLVFQQKNMIFKDFIDNEIELPSSYHAYGNVRLSEYLAGRIALKTLCDHPQKWDFFSNQLGAPVFPPSLQGSLSHSKNIVFAALSRDKDTGGIGADVQHWISEEEFELIKFNVVNDKENNLIKNHLDFTIIFSAKESLIKAISNHFSVVLDFNDFQIVNLISNKVYINTDRLELSSKLFVVNYYCFSKGVVSFIQLKG